MFLNSNKVNMYPSSFRGDGNKDTNNNSQIYDIESKLATEKNLVGYYNRIPSNNSYVVSWSKDAKILECVIAGYYFRLNLNDAADIDSWTELWISVKTEELRVALELNSSTIDTQILTGFDDNKILDINDKFKGIELSSTEKAANVSSLHALTRTSTANDWKIAELSDVRFKTSHVGIVDENGITTKYLSDVIKYEDKKIKATIDEITSKTIVKPVEYKAGVSDITLDAESSKIEIQCHSSAAEEANDAPLILSSSFDNNLGFSNKIENVTSIQTNQELKKNLDEVNIGASNNRFTNLYVENVDASKKMTISNITANNSTTSSIGESNNYFYNAYITNVHSDKIDVSTLADVTTISSPTLNTSILNINGVAQITPKNIESVPSGLGNSNNRFSFGFINNLTTKNLTLDLDFQRLKSTTKLTSGTYELYLAKIRNKLTEYYSFSLLEVMSTSTGSSQISYAHANVAIGEAQDLGYAPTYFYAFQLKIESTLNTLNVYKFVDSAYEYTIPLDNDDEITIEDAKIAATYQVFYRKIF